MLSDEKRLQVYVRLTLRQRQVMQLASEGLSNPEIAGLLYIQPCTVANHLSQVYAALERMDDLAESAANRYTLIRVFSGFFERFPNLNNFPNRR